MFAEELEGNATKRRQEEARARRRKLKQQQDQKKKAEQQAQQQRAAAASSVANVSANTSANENGTNGFAATVIEAPSAVEIPSTKEDNKNSAVQNALQQREIRQLAQSQVKAALKIQCFYRMHKSNSDLLQYHAALLQKRLQDLQTLTDLLKQQATEYIPPPATSGALTCQLMFLTRSLPYSSSKKVQLRDNVPKVQQLLELALLPGMFSTDENSNPFLSWLQDDVGQRRIESLIRIALVVSTTPNRDISVVSTMLEFVNALAGTAIDKVPDAIVKFGKSRLWHSSPPSTQLSIPPVMKGRREPPILAFGSTLDLVTLLRYNLMFITGGPDPIPKTAEQARQKCIAPQARNQSHQLFQTVVKGSGTDNALRLRFLTEILTVPLLTWKIADVSSQTLLQPLASANSNIKKPFLILLLENFINCNSESLNEGQIKQVLCNDTSLTVCPATPAQSLLANLLQVGRLSSLLNGLHRSQLHFEYATIFYQIIATLVDAIPLATFTSRESVVEWISDGKGHHSPVVLSSVVMEQCRYLLSDSFVRTLFDCAIDDQVLQTEMTLNQKNEKDRKQETLLQAAGVNAASMAAKEARLDRKRGFWNSSSWAQRIKGGVTKMLSSNDGSGSKKADSKLIDATSVSRQLASGEATAKASKEEKVTQTTYSPALFKVLCRLYGIILARWGGDGGRNYIRRSKPLFRIDTKGAKQEIATTTADNCTVSLLNTIIFSTNVIRASWAVIQSDAKTVADVYAIIDQHKGRSPVFTFSAHPQYKMQGRNNKHSANNDGAAMLFLFVSALSRILIVTDDSEIHEMGKPLPLHQVRRCIQTLKQLLYRACCLDEASLGNSEDNRRKYPTSYFGLALINASARTTRDLYDRSSRRPLAVPKLWLIDDLMEKEIRRCKSKEDYVNLLSTPVLRVCPFLVSFKRRLKLFERIVTADRVAIQGENSQNPFHNNPLKPGIPIRITRGRILEDGLATMNHLGRNMRERLAVQYFNEAGMRETGIDAGGLFKEFWTDLCAIAFDPNYALFRVTEENCMYPNPSSGAAHGSDHVMLFEFLGRILGKALYEGITVGPQFAHFFLSHLRGDYKYLNMLSDLSTMDAQLYNNIMFLKTYDGDAEDLCLTFTVAVDDFGGNREIPLMPNGQNIEVTNRNKQLYIQLVAKYYVVDRIKEQAEAFTRGLREVIDRAWLEIFNEPELQVLISGASEENLDVDDMRAHCRYAGGFTGLDRTTNRFWSVVASLDSKEQADFLRFVTSCERPPPLGFGSLNPPLTIQRVGILRDGDKLPSSSTCFNVLKLPTYSSEKVMKERLLYAIQSGAGFELT